ncbi:zinc ribbon domain-containing protein [bacterium 1xD8-6]|nr:zinc ribbon domain-containing protein [Lachnospiraceae bacterium]RKI25567.1 zinc ribbon domain-containing protein [bacterium D16-36]RKI68044.1 zinc ribbon domain-containing protein [bacterium 1xD8-6]
MFCINCGNEIKIKESSFCPYCGSKLPEINSVIEQETISTFQVVTQKENIITSIFSKYFSPNDDYGDYLMISDEDGIQEEEMEDYIGKDRMLMFFDYCGKGEMGFLLTEKEFIVGEGQRIKRYALKKIKSFIMDKSMLADVMYIMTDDGKRSREIYLTSIRDVKHFQITFLKFFDEVYSYYHPEYVNKKQEISLYNIGAICEQHLWNSPYAEIGNPLNEKNSKKYYKAVVNFVIDVGEEVYLIYDTTTFGSCKQGFSICSTGIYGCDDNNRKFYISWETFKTISYRKTLLNFKIENRGFIMAIGDTNKIIKIFDAIKAVL